ncbi:MAG TPA: hypothetical protein VLT16_01325 [Candidatus Limnocylindrales bacterium]|nr:hypothetical protein [Candidatus Limnocylindrales bacterium]
MPLGAGFCGTCRAGSCEFKPCEDELREFCNLGYAAQCAHMPEERRADCVRFAVAKDEGQRIALYYAYERDHAPVDWGTVAYDVRTGQWAWSIEDVCVQRQAECYLAAYLERRPR